MGDSSLLPTMINAVLPLVDSLGLNEQELADMYIALDGKFTKELRKENLIATVPDPDTVAKAIKHVFKETKPDTRKLSRIHFHCFGFHIIAQLIPEALEAGGSGFSNTLVAAVAGSVKATHRACNTTKFQKSDLQIHISDVRIRPNTVIQLTAANPYAEWTTRKDENDLIHFTLVPVITCAKPVQTVGLGDSISSTALAYQI